MATTLPSVALFPRSGKDRVVLPLPLRAQQISFAVGASRADSTTFPLLGRPGRSVMSLPLLPSHQQYKPGRKLSLTGQYRQSQRICTLCSANICWQDSSVSQQERRKLLHQKGCIVWFTGLSGSGKSTVAFTVDRLLTSMGKLCYVLDGDNLRHGLNKNLGFSASDRQENIRRVGEVAKLFADAGLITFVSLISPYKGDRDIVRELVPSGEFIEVFMNVPLDVCERRDCKGLYKLARAGIIKGFTGIDDPYEKPQSPEISLKDTTDEGDPVSSDEMAWTVVNYLSEKGFLCD